MACGVPYLIASGYRAANPTGALRREVPRAEILATPLMLAQRRRRAARRRSAALARTDALGDLLLSRLRKLGLFLGVLALELLEIDLFDCDVDVFEVLRGVLDEYRQLALLDLAREHGGDRKTTRLYPSSYTSQHQTFCELYQKGSAASLESEMVRTLSSYQNGTVLEEHLSAGSVSIPFVQPIPHRKILYT